MKKEIFNKYVEAVAKTFGITEEELFENTKKRETVDARQIIYWLCSDRNMSVGYIQNYLLGKGFGVSHSTIIHGKRRANNLIEEDIDLSRMVQDIKSSV
jgi:chromosomal replication initiation ATPase DnaA